MLDIATTNGSSPFQHTKISGDDQRTSKVNKCTFVDGSNDNFRSNPGRVAHRYDKWLCHKAPI